MGDCGCDTDCICFDKFFTECIQRQQKNGPAISFSPFGKGLRVYVWFGYAEAGMEDESLEGDAYEMIEELADHLYNELTGDRCEDKIREWMFFFDSSAEYLRERLSGNRCAFLNKVSIKKQGIVLRRRIGTTCGANRGTTLVQKSGGGK